jgi:hypothetical protein
MTSSLSSGSRRGIEPPRRGGRSEPKRQGTHKSLPRVDDRPLSGGVHYSDREPAGFGQGVERRVWQGQADRLDPADVAAEAGPCSKRMTARQRTSTDQPIVRMGTFLDC